MNLMKKWFLIPAALAALMILPLSCASAPEQPVEEPVQDNADATDTQTGQAAQTPAPSRELMDAARTTAMTARDKAVAAKAPKAEKELFTEAEELMASGESYGTGSDYANAISEYTKAAAIYNDAASKSDQKRADALAAMKAADEAIANVEKNADEATKAATEEDQ